jgi:hypothetical protein
MAIRIKNHFAMFTLRCTKKLLDRVRPTSQDATPSRSTTALGDWTANMVILNRQQLVVAVSGRTLLPVILPLAPAKTLPARFPAAVGDVLLRLMFDPMLVAAEMSAMAECFVDRTNDRRVLGSLNEFIFMLEWYLDGRPLVDVALHLAKTPCGPLRGEYPSDVARAALVAGPLM